MIHFVCAKTITISYSPENQICLFHKMQQNLGRGHPTFDISVTKCSANRFKLKQTEKQTATLQFISQTQTDPHSSDFESFS